MHTPKPAAVLFDLDGTLLDSAPDFYRLLNQMRAERGLAKIDEKKLRQQVSNGATAMIQSAFDIDAEDPACDSLRLQLLDLYEQSPAEESRLFEGMDSLLQWLETQQIPWGIVTNKPERFSLPILRQLDLDARCSALICPEQVEQNKPHPEGLLSACALLNCQPQQSIYVGDHRRDIEAGINAGMRTIAACYGYLTPQDKPDNWNADHLVDSPQQLLDWLQSPL